jgi:hypothetical protein
VIARLVPSCFVAGLVWLALAASQGCADPARRGDLIVERRAVSLNLLPDGSVEVRERFIVRFLAEPVSRFRRTVPADRVDAFIDVRAGMDGEALTTDAGGVPHVSIAREPELDVEWTFPATEDASREFVLEYRAVGVVAVHGANALLYWPLLPIAPAFPVAALDVTLAVPGNAVFMAAPTVDASAPWTVTPRADGLSASRQGIGPGEHAAVLAQLATDTLSLGQPTWQFDAALAAELVPAFISGGLFMLVIAAGIVWMVHARYPAPGNGPAGAPAPGAAGRPTPQRAPVLPPAFLVALRRRRRLRGLPEMRAALSGLREKGVIALDGQARIEPAERMPDVPVRLGAIPDTLRPHEQVIADELWLHKDEQGWTPTGALRLARGVRDRFRTALLKDLVHAGLVDEERISVARGLVSAGFVVIAMGLACSAVVVLALGRYGPWAHAVPAGIVGLGAILAVAGRRFGVLTESGERAARQ